MNTPPNILFFMTDHSSARALAPGSPCHTPHLDALVRDGVRFARCYTTNAICSPARASLMTSLYPSSHGMWDCTHTQRREWLDVPAERFAHFSSVLARAGYYNGYFGKWHVEQSGKLEQFGWHEYDITADHAPFKPAPHTAITVHTDGYRDFLLAGVDETTANTRHPAVAQGMAFIQRAAARQQPFCCFVSTAEPHDPYVPPAQWWNKYDWRATPLPPTLRDDPVNKPEIIQRLRTVWRDVHDDDWRRVITAYYAVISYLDAELGALVELLRQTGLYDNTIIVFTSDHGDMMGGHGLLTKGGGTAYEEVYNIPLIMRVPGITRGGEDEQSVVSLVDLAPTLLDLCGAPPLPDAQGRSLRPVLERHHEPTEWQDAYAEFYGQRFVYTQRIVWHDHWKFVFTPGGVDELYNLHDDPYERQNLASNPQYASILRAMCARMWSMMKRIGDRSLLESHYATLRTAPVGPLARLTLPDESSPT